MFLDLRGSDDTETKGNTKNILGNLRVTSAKQFDLPIDFLETSSLKNQTNEFLVEQIRKLSSYLSSQQSLVRNKRQANEPKDQLTVVSLKGNIKEVNLGPLRAVTNQGT
ncbi:hypothetical protein C0J52_03282 [Blattella germanica]|nr:hypothetical protein C0J52_03282 [Blattella germanica]